MSALDIPLLIKITSNELVIGSAAWFINTGKIVDGVMVYVNCRSYIDGGF